MGESWVVGGYGLGTGRGGGRGGVVKFGGGGGWFMHMPGCAMQTRAACQLIYRVGMLKHNY